MPRAFEAFVKADKVLPRAGSDQIFARRMAKR